MGEGYVGNGGCQLGEEMRDSFLLGSEKRAVTLFVDDGVIKTPKVNFERQLHTKR